MYCYYLLCSSEVTILVEDNAASSSELSITCVRTVVPSRLQQTCSSLEWHFYRLDALVADVQRTASKQKIVTSFTVKYLE